MRSFIANEDFSGYKIVQDEYNEDKEKKLFAMYHAIHQLKNPIDKTFIEYNKQEILLQSNKYPSIQNSQDLHCLHY